MRLPTHANVKCSDSTINTASNYFGAGHTDWHYTILKGINCLHNIWEVKKKNLTTIPYGFNKWKYLDWITTLWPAVKCTHRTVITSWQYNRVVLIKLHWIDLHEAEWGIGDYISAKKLWIIKNQSSLIILKYVPYQVFIFTNGPNNKALSTYGSACELNNSLEEYHHRSMVLENCFVHR
jgi:hypothetical protein